MNKLFFVVFACVFFGVVATAGARTELHRGNASEPDTLDPQKANIVPDQTIIADLFLRLVSFDVMGKEIPGAASHWEISEDGLTYTFHLRDGLLWSDGSALTAADFEAGIRRLYTPTTGSQAAVYAYMVENAQAVHEGRLPPSDLGVQAIDPATIQIRLYRPEPLFLQTAGSVWFSPIPRASVSEHGNAWTKPENFIGNGPFILREWSPNDLIVLEKNPHFFEADKVKLTQVKYYPSENSESALKRFRAGELDFVSGVPSHKIDFLLSNLAEETKLSSNPSVNYIIFNMSIPPFDDVRVRAALSMAIDRKIYTTKILRKGEEVAYSFVPNAVTGYQTVGLAYKDVPMAERQEQARELLAAAGFNEDSPLTFDFRVRGSPDRRRGAVAVTSMWKAIGVEVKFHSTELKTHYADISSGKFVVAGAGLVGSTGPGFFLEEFLSTNIQGNSSKYANEAFDTLLNQAFQIANLEERYTLMAEAERHILRDHPVAPINYGVTGNLVAQHLKGYENNIYDVHPSRFMWIEE